MTHVESSIPKDILKIQKKLCEYEVGSRSYKKYVKILAKHVKHYLQKQPLEEDRLTIEQVKKLRKT